MNTLNHPFMLVIAGPTAVGKTDFALRLAATIPAEIVNGDVGQFYLPLTIGTAKPDWHSSTIPHHLFDILDEPKDFNVQSYRSLLLEVVQGIWDRGNIPFIVGGSLFYLKSIFFPPADSASVTGDTASQLLDTEMSWDSLLAIDPERAKNIHPHDTYRIRRALDLWHATSTKPSEHTISYDPPSNALFLFLTRHRADLYTRINSRVEQMIDQGWIDEVAELDQTPWHAFLKRKKIIGYDDIQTYLAHTQSEQARAVLIAYIQQRTRRYAKRQHTFWRMLERAIAQATHSRYQVKTMLLDLTAHSDDLYISQLSEQLMMSGLIRSM